MSESVLRRSSYGPTSPHVGTAGSRTRESIVAESLRLFGEQGFYKTSVQDIAAAAGVSRATLYQYFESKEAIFIELLNESGRALAGARHALVRVGPDADGFRHLRGWMAFWAQTYDRYAMLFAEWANIHDPNNPITPMVSSWQKTFNAGIARTLKANGVQGIAPDDAALVLTSVMLRFNYLRQKYPLIASAESAYHMAVLLQLLLFPDTPPDAVRPEDDEPQEWFHKRVSEAPPVRRSRSRAKEHYHQRLSRLTARNAGTVQELMRSASHLFAEKGYHATSVDEIVAGADYARGTFYKYFDEKIDLLVALSEACSQELTALARRLGRLTPGPAGSPQLRRWMNDSLTAYAQYRGVHRTWMDQSASPELQDLQRQVIHAMRRSLHTLLSQIDRPYPLDLHISATLVVALKEEVPETVRLNARDISHEDLTEVLSTVLERTILLSPPGDGDRTDKRLTAGPAAGIGASP